MCAMNIAFTEKLAILDADLCASTAAAALLSSAWIDVRRYHRIRAIGMAAGIVGTNTLTVIIQNATSVLGANAAAVRTVTLRAKPGETRDLVCINEIFESALTQGYTFVRGQVSHDDAGGNRDLSILLMGGEPVIKPVEGEEFETGTTSGPPTTTTTAAA